MILIKLHGKKGEIKYEGAITPLNGKIPEIVQKGEEFFRFWMQTPDVAVYRQTVCITELSQNNVLIL
jgi:hypothetical protein